MVLGAAHRPPSAPWGGGLHLPCGPVGPRPRGRPPTPPRPAPARSPAPSARPPRPPRPRGTCLSRIYRTPGSAGSLLPPARSGRRSFLSPLTSPRVVGSSTLAWSPRQPPRTRTRVGRRSGTPGAGPATAPPPARARVTWGAARGNCGGGGDGVGSGDGGGGRSALAGPARRLRRLCRYRASPPRTAPPRPRPWLPAPLALPQPVRVRPATPPGTVPLGAICSPDPRNPFVSPFPWTPASAPPLPDSSPSLAAPLPDSMPALHPRRAPCSGSAPSPRTRQIWGPTHPSAAPLAPDPSPGLPARLRDTPLSVILYSHF